MQIFRGAVFIFLLALGLLPGSAQSAPAAYKVLVVFSYGQDFPWNAEIRAGIENAFRDKAELHYFYMDTKVNLAAGPQRAEEAFAVFQRLRPDGVIAADDNAQSMFVVPYLMNRVATPVIFCGVNAAPQEYNYPAANVSGILERFHLEETLSFSRQFSPQIKTFSFLIKQSPVAELIRRQLVEDAEKLSARLVSFHPVQTAAEALQVADDLRGKTDLLMIESLFGVHDDNGQPVNERQLVSQVVHAFAGPTAATNTHTVKYGALNAVIKSGREQGSVAAQMLLQAMQGTPLAELPITRNYRGKRMLNLTTMKQLGISPTAITLRGTELVLTDDE